MSTKETAEADIKKLEWRCDGCWRKYAEYVNGCLACWPATPGQSRKVTCIEPPDYIRTLEKEHRAMREALQRCQELSKYKPEAEAYIQLGQIHGTAEEVLSTITIHD